MIELIPGPLFFDVWASDDIIGTALGEMTMIRNRVARGQEDGMDTGAFEFNLNETEQRGWSQPGNVVRVRRVGGGPFDYDSENYILAFVITEGDDTVVSTDEQGGQWCRRQGLGLEVLLDDGLIYFEATFVDDIGDVYDRTVPSDAQWHIEDPDASSTGTVLRIFLRNADAMSPNPIADFVIDDFNTISDSLGNAWPDSDTKWSFDVGTSLVEVLQILVAAGLHYRITPDLVIHAYVNPQGQDRSASVSIEAGQLVRESGTVSIHASPVKTRVLVQGQTDNGRQVFEPVVDAGIETEVGKVKWGFARYPFSPTPAKLQQFGAKYLTDLKGWSDGTPDIGVAEDSGRQAFNDYFPGDTIHVDIDELPSDGDLKVHAITLTDQETETGHALVILEFGGVPFVADAPRIEASGGCNDCGCDLGTPVEDTTPVAYLGEVYGPSFAGVSDGGPSDEFFFKDQSGTTILEYVRGTALVFVDGVMEPGDWSEGIIGPPAGDVYVYARVACELADQGCGT